jgi:basic membrane protein A
MEKKRSFVTLFLFSVFLLSTFALSANLTFSASAQTETKNIAVVFSTGGLGDKSFNDAAYEGMQRANDTYDVNIDYVEPTTVTEINNAIENYASSTEIDYDLIIAIGFSSGDGVNASALAHTDKNFVIIDSVIDLPNVRSVVFQEHEGSFLAGAMAAMTTKSDKLGFLGGLDIPLINKFGSGFAQGARYINPDVEVMVAYSPDASNPWGDTAGGKTVAEGFIADGVDIIYAAAGGTGLGVFDAAAEAADEGKTVYGIGVDSNQDYIKEGFVLTSMVKRVDVAVEDQIKAIAEDTWEDGFVALGLADDGVGITDMEFTDYIADSQCTADDTRMEVVQQIKADIIAGTIIVDEEFQAEADYNTVAHECTDAVPNNPKVTSAPGFETTFTLFGLLIIAAIPIIRKRK